VSGFACACHGFICAEDGEKSFKIIKPGKGNDGYWTNDDLVKQLDAVMPLFARYHPEQDCLFMFDNSQNHKAKAPGGLSADAGKHGINLSDGGKNTLPLRDTIFDGVVQRMQRPDGVQKGIKTILQERRCWRDGMKLDCQACNDKKPGDDVSCCARRLLNSHPDFQAQKSWLEETIERGGHSMIMLPKFHPELSFIEMIWGYLKCSLRHVCSFSYADLHARLPGALLSIPIPSIRRFSRHCFRFMDGYRQGLHGPVLDFIMKKFKAHRCIDPSSVGLLKEEFAKRVRH
jgi:hypothetical protein